MFRAKQVYTCNANYGNEKSLDHGRILAAQFETDMFKTRGRSAQDPPIPSRRLFCSDAISDEDIDRTEKGSKCDGRAPTGLLFIAYMVDVGNMLQTPFLTKILPISKN